MALSKQLLNELSPRELLIYQTAYNEGMLNLSNELGQESETVVKVSALKNEMEAFVIKRGLEIINSVERT